jgi:hypothetical protein
VKKAVKAKTKIEIKGLEKVKVGETELLYFPVAVGAYKGMYLYIKEPQDANLMEKEQEAAIREVVRLRMRGYAVGVCDNAEDAEEAVNYYIRAKKDSSEVK